MANETEKTTQQLNADAIVANALRRAGVPARDIEAQFGTAVLEPEAGATEDEDGETAPESESKPSEKKVEPNAKEQPLSKADLDKAVRSMQSMMDKRINALQSDVRQTLQTIVTSLSGQELANIESLPPEQQAAKYKSLYEKVTSGEAKKVEMAQPISFQETPAYQFMVNILDAVGIGADDPGIKWDEIEKSSTMAEASTKLSGFIKAIQAEKTKATAKEADKAKKKNGTYRVPGGSAGSAQVDLNKLSPRDKIKVGIALEDQARQLQ